ncbi:DUF3887 domain-containing protein [Pelosinus sp. sgz500959]|uniref:DUF3887 domain-containing protein n=1 Tax=Pelosinus sp. sgz500959 TaxID=3242472 RepID=UPI00366E23BF
MKLYKNILLLTALILLIILSGCSAQEIPLAEVKQYADPITENILIAMNEDNYSRFSQDFDEQMKNGLDEIKYYNTIPGMKNKIGQYISKELVSVEKKDQFVVVTYKAKFSEESGDVIVRSVFSDRNGKNYISGFWMDSQKLRGN